jgi:hypothetical protein
MPAVAPKPVATTARWNVVKDTALISALVLGVTAGGVALGALGIAPMLRNASMQRVERVAREAIGHALEFAGAIAGFVGANPAIAMATAIASVVFIAIGAAYRSRGRAPGIFKAGIRRRRQSQASAATAYTPRTPRDVQVLAAAGQAPVDIAIRTRLSVDAVSMLLQLGQGETVSAAR